MKSTQLVCDAQTVLALMGGSKTQMRKVMTPQPISDRQFSGGYYIAPTKQTKGNSISVWASYVGVACPCGNIGDQLWVRETWAPLTKGYAYRADAIWN